MGVTESYSNNLNLLVHELEECPERTFSDGALANFQLDEWVVVDIVHTHLV